MITQIKKIEIQNKLTNYLIINGKKNKSEKIICKIFKILQQKLKKSSKKLLQFALVLNLPLFKIHKITKKKIKKQKTKVIPAFICSKISRLFFSIKFITSVVKKKNNKTFLKSFIEKILEFSKTNTEITITKIEIQKQVFVNRHLFKYYRWH